jgi:hypothetical protein
MQFSRPESEGGKDEILQLLPGRQTWEEALLF